MLGVFRFGTGREKRDTAVSTMIPNGGKKSESFRALEGEKQRRISSFVLLH